LAFFDGQDFVDGRGGNLLGRAAGPADFYQINLGALLKAEVETQVVLRGVARAAADFVRLREVAGDDADARAVLKVLRKEWEMATCDLREASKLNERPRFTKALDELQRTLKVIPQEVLYEPWFTYIWGLSEGRFARELSQKVKREDALREVARSYLACAGMTLRGELAKVTGLSRHDAGKGNHALVREGFAERIEEGVYRLADFDERMKAEG